MANLIPYDTLDEAAMVQFEVLKKMGPAKRAELAVQLSNTLRQITEAGVRHRHPEYTDEQVTLAALRLSIGDELFKQAFPNCEVTG